MRNSHEVPKTNYFALLRRGTWWKGKTADKVIRTYVILAINYKWSEDSAEFIPSNIILLEQLKSEEKQIAWEKMIEWIDKGILQPI